MSQEISLEPAKPDDGPAINRLFKTVFGRDRSLESWHWKFYRNPHGEAIVLVARRGGRIIGHYGLMPRKVRFRDREMTAYQEVDLMILREEAKGGLFRRMGREIYQWVQEKGGAFTFGFPNQTSLPAGRRILKWRAIGRIPLFTWPLRGKAVTQRHWSSIPGKALLNGILTALLGAYAHVRLKTPDVARKMRFDEWKHDQTTDPERFVFVRDEAYLRWRYETCPHTRYIFIGDGGEGRAVLGLSGEEAHLTELRFESFEVMKRLTAYAVRIARHNGAHVLRVWALEESPEAALLAKIGFFRRDSKLYHVIRSFQSPEFNRLLWDPRRWYVSSGDSDFV